MKRVLIISYHFPPFDCTASVEASKFTKFLPRHGWQPVVVSTETGLPRTLPVEMDERVVFRTRHVDLNRLPKLVMRGAETTGYETDGTRVSGRVLARLGYSYKQFVNFPDGQIGWYPFALREAKTILAENPVDLILSSAWPVTNHLVASRLASSTQLPWIADFRDLWTDNHWFRRRGRILPAIERSLEKRVLQPASVLTSPSEEWSALLSRRFGKRSEVIPNGFDPEDYPRDVPSRGPFTLAYTGVFYPNRQSARPLIKAVARLKERGLIDPHNFQVRLVGRHLKNLGNLTREANIDDLVTIEPTVSHREALRLQVESSALLFFPWTDPEGRGWYSAKLYEYIGAQRPILAIGPGDGVAAKMISRLNAGVVSSSADEIAAILSDWISEWRNGNSPRSNTSHQDYAALQWHPIVSKLGVIMDAILDEPTANQVPPWSEASTPLPSS